MTPEDHMSRREYEDTQIEWHQHDAGRQVVVSVDGDQVRIAVALSSGASMAALDAALDELEREFDHVRRTDEGRSWARS